MVEKVLIGAAGLGIASLAGSVIGLFVKRISHKWNDIFMGFCAGMMLAASIVGLVAPAVTMASLSGWLPVSQPEWRLSECWTISLLTFIILPVLTSRSIKGTPPLTG